MDNTEDITLMSWFSGYAGMEIGLKRVIPGIRTIVYCEREAYAVANLVSKIEARQLDAAPIWSDVTTFPVERFRGLVDIFAASYPCQGFSLAGLQKGEQDSRFLWPWVFRAVVTIQPRICFFENVEGHVNNGLRRVVGDLEAAGYRCTFGIFSAEEVGAPHRRKRVFILAVPRNGQLPEPWRGTKGRDGLGPAGAELAEPPGGRRAKERPGQLREQGGSDAPGGGGPMGDTQCQPGEARGPDGALPAQPEGGPGPGHSGHELADPEHDTIGAKQRKEPGRGGDAGQAEEPMSGGSWPDVGHSEGKDRRSQQQPGGEGGGRSGPSGAGREVADAGGSGLPERGGFRGDDEQEQPAAERDGHPLADANSGGQQQPEGNERVERRWAGHCREEFPPGPGLGGAGVLDDIRAIHSKDPERAWRKYQIELANTLKWREIPPELWPAVESGVHKLADGASSGLDESRADQLRLAGNGVVPGTVSRAFTVLMEKMKCHVK